jgi:HSP20 family protein
LHEKERDMAMTTLARPEQKIESLRDLFGRMFDRDLRLMRQMTRDIDRLFGDFGMRTPVFDRFTTDVAWIPELEVYERDGRFVVRADLPGMRKEDVKVNVQDNVLIIEGERKVEDELKKDGFHRTERSYGTFFRSLPLPEGVKLDKIDAIFKDGVLEIGMPIVEAKKSVKNVEVKIA